MLTLQVVGDSIYQGTKISWNLNGLKFIALDWKIGKKIMSLMAQLKATCTSRENISNYFILY